MDLTSLDEYTLAVKQGQKEIAELSAAGKPTEPKVLDDILPTMPSAVDLGILEIPANRIVGTKSAGRITAFSPSFRPLLAPNSEFGMKWIRLCDAHLGDTGITDPIECFEYLGEFYVQEGNKRVSVLRHFGAPRIPAHVRRIVPALSDDPTIRTYYEFLDFYKLTKLYTVRYRTPGHYAKLLTLLHKKNDYVWTEEDRRYFRANYQYFLEAFETLDTKKHDILPEEALLLWLQVYSFPQLSELTATELKKSLASLRDDLLSASTEKSVKMQTHVDATAKGSIIDKLFSGSSGAIRVAFIHQRSPAASPWALAHDQGRAHIEKVFGDKIHVRTYCDACDPEAADAALEAAVADGAQVIFTTSPPLSQAALKAAVKYPKVEIFNCSADRRYSSVKSYYARIYEGKFITGAIAGAMAQNNRIGYIASYPIFGEPASINAFALGAQLVNPRAQIELHWSSTEGNHQAELFADGIRVISNREVPVRSAMYMDFANYGTYLMDDSGTLIPLASPVWVWGKFYEYVIRGIINGTLHNDKSGATALNYWLGIDSGVISVDFSPKLPEGVRTMAGFLRRGLAGGLIDPFFRKIIAQDGTVKNDGTHTFTPTELLHMDWLCENVVGKIPAIEEILPMSRPLVEQMGIYRQKEEIVHADSGSI